jgi:hypothetical protein
MIFVVVLCTIIILQMVLVSRRSRAALEKWAEQNDIWIIEMDYRILRRGPFFWTISRNQTVYRVTVVDRNSNSRRGWVRCGDWFWGVLLSDNVEVRWDDS